MRVAIYARYSSEGQREASIDDQNRNCEAYAKRHGWRIVERYADKAISGTKDETGRDVQSEKMVEVVFAGDKPVETGDQFGIGRIGQGLR